MKVTIGKNESHYYPRESFHIRGGEWLSVPPPSRVFRCTWYGLCFMLAVAFVLMNGQEVTDHSLFYMITYVLYLPIHELCHALYLWLTHRRVYAIRFCPYWFKWGREGAYIKPDMSLFTRGEYTLLSVFPLLLLSIIPAAVALFCPELRAWLGWIVIINLAGASFDISNVLRLLHVPKDAFWTDGAWYRFHEGETVILQRIRIKPGATRMSDIERAEFRVEGKHLVEVPVTDSDDVLVLLNEFKTQFQLSDT